ncbi:hypothetical protein OsJ_12155 [Oryza sativa Japonica Group]|uniref:Uncharacterized protein n=1 Tax=Oryza sativa subsp. japonica TaxID=39947 RepID=B9FAN8_ORYSJ|nr:hypothetical protein OsJ_12155 [Oryza sativa Japonica Group]
MSEHLALRSSVGSHSSALPPSYHHHRRLPPPQQQHPDPLNSVWIRRLHLLPHQPPPPPPPWISINCDYEISLVIAAAYPSHAVDMVPIRTLQVSYIKLDQKEGVQDLYVVN